MLEIIGPLHGVQVALLVFVAIFCVLVAKQLWVTAPLDVEAVLRQVERLDPKARQTFLRALLRTGAAETFAGRLVSAELVDPTTREEVEFDLRCELGGYPTRLKALGRVATGLGLLGAVVQVLWLFNGSHGLLGLQAGLPGQVATGAAMLSLALGLGTGLFSRVAMRAFAPAVRAVERSMRRLQIALSGSGELAFAVKDCEARENHRNV